MVATVVTTVLALGYSGDRTADLFVPVVLGLAAGAGVYLIKNSLEFGWHFAIAGHQNEIDDLRAELARRPPAGSASLSVARRIVLGELQVVVDQLAVVSQTRPYPHYSENFHLSTARWDMHEATIAAEPELHALVAPAYTAIQNFNNRREMRLSRKGDSKLLAVIGDDQLDEVEKTVKEAIAALSTSGPTPSIRFDAPERFTYKDAEDHETILFRIPVHYESHEDHIRMETHFSPLLAGREFVRPAIHLLRRAVPWPWMAQNPITLRHGQSAYIDLMGFQTQGDTSKCFVLDVATFEKDSFLREHIELLDGEYIVTVKVLYSDRPHDAKKFAVTVSKDAPAPITLSEIAGE